MNLIYDFDKNFPLIMEVIDFVNDGFLLSRKSIRKNYKSICNNLEEAQDYAWEKTYIGEGYTWTNLREEESSKLLGYVYRHKDKIEIEKQIEIFYKKIEKKLWLTPPYDELVDDFDSDFSDIITSRALQGTSNPFFEKLFAAYKSGGWPCGWHGSWPDGEPIVFYPPNDFVK